MATPDVPQQTLLLWQALLYYAPVAVLMENHRSALGKYP